MEEAAIELALRDLARRLVVLIGQVNNGELVDRNLLKKLSEVLEQAFIRYLAGNGITDEEISYMIDLLNLLEMRTTLIYGNPPKN
jgi:hypothetical protein